MKQTKILILESNEQFAEELRAYFASRENYTVIGVIGDGAEGMQALKDEPDVVIISLLLKTLDGFTVMERAKKEGCKAAFIALGNFADDKIINRAIALGARYYLMKPVTAAVVGDRVVDLSEEEQPAAYSVREAERRKFGSLDERISNIFISIGIPPHIKGYGYLREGIKMAVEDPQVINNITKGLYPVIGERFQTTASKVERAIRHAIEVAWNRGRIDAVNAIFGARVYIGTEKPTNSEFIALVADKLILESMV
ncbi:MAG: sporulation transcription factor Spo0A [Clostridiales bacterium]|nr:sporulation transcription factor Spo0A [Clostridiales bacterium]